MVGFINSGYPEYLLFLKQDTVANQHQLGISLENSSKVILPLVVEWTQKNKNSTYINDKYEDLWELAASYMFCQFADSPETELRMCFINSLVSMTTTSCIIILPNQMLVYTSQFIPKLFVEDRKCWKKHHNLSRELGRIHIDTSTG